MIVDTALKKRGPSVTQVYLHYTRSDQQVNSDKYGMSLEYVSVLGRDGIVGLGLGKLPVDLKKSLPQIGQLSCTGGSTVWKIVDGKLRVTRY